MQESAVPAETQAERHSGAADPEGRQDGAAFQACCFKARRCIFLEGECND